MECNPVHSQSHADNWPRQGIVIVIVTQATTPLEFLDMHSTTNIDETRAHDRSTYAIGWSV